MVRDFLVGIAAVALSANVAIQSAHADDRPVVGLVAAFSGPYAQWGESYKREIDLYMHQHDGKDGNPKINLLLRDTPGTDPSRTKQVVQEFITRDGAAVVGGGEFTPEALAVAPLVTEAKIPYVIFNGATSFIVDKSPYLVRVGFTIWQPNVPLADYAAAHGCKKVTIDCRRLCARQGHCRRANLRFPKAWRNGGRSGQGSARHHGLLRLYATSQGFASGLRHSVHAWRPDVAHLTSKDFAAQGFAQQGIVLYDAGGVTAEN